MTRFENNAPKRSISEQRFAEYLARESQRDLFTRSALHAGTGKSVSDFADATRVGDDFFRRISSFERTEPSIDERTGRYGIPGVASLVESSRSMISKFTREVAELKASFESLSGWTKELAKWKDQYRFSMPSLSLRDIGKEIAEMTRPIRSVGELQRLEKEAKDWASQLQASFGGRWSDSFRSPTGSVSDFGIKTKMAALADLSADSALGARLCGSLNLKERLAEAEAALRAGPPASMLPIPLWPVRSPCRCHCTEHQNPERRGPRVRVNEALVRPPKASVANVSPLSTPVTTAGGQAATPCESVKIQEVAVAQASISLTEPNRILTKGQNELIKPTGDHRFRSALESYEWMACKDAAICISERGFEVTCARVSQMIRERKLVPVYENEQRMKRVIGVLRSSVDNYVESRRAAASTRPRGSVTNGKSPL